MIRVGTSQRRMLSLEHGHLPGRTLLSTLRGNLDATVAGTDDRPKTRPVISTRRNMADGLVLIARLSAP